MATARGFNTGYLATTLTWFKTEITSVPMTRDAHVLLLAIAGQESGWADIQQGGGGPGRGPWQFETETCAELIANPASMAAVKLVCGLLGVTVTMNGIYGNLIGNARLATAMARLDLFCNPHPLPAAGNPGDGWQYYVNTWRPA